MQRLRTLTNNHLAADRCARELLTSALAVMRFIRARMRAHHRGGLSVPQFRALVFLSQHDEASLSALAEHVGLSLPAASRLVDLLVRRQMVERQAHAGDRRRVSLSLTARGRATFQAALRATQLALASRFATLSERELSQLSRTMGLLEHLFAAENCRPARPAAADRARRGALS
jgi:DNA-binding MarR family transcriptional regulator